MTLHLPTYFISHGGGPWPWLAGPYRREFQILEQSLVGIAGELRQVGAAEHDAAHRVYHEAHFMGGVTASSYRFGDAPTLSAAPPSLRVAPSPFDAEGDYVRPGSF